MNWLLNRLKERSTWLAIFTLAGLFGMKIEPELREHIINAILAVAAIAAFVFRENIRERSTDLDQSSGTATPLPPGSGYQPLPSIEFVGRSESVPNPPPVHPNGAVVRNRRVTDAWMHDPVPSEAGFKRQGVANHEPVGWNDDY